VPATLGAAQFFSGAGLTGSTAAGQGAGIYYNTTAGSLYYDADGFGGAASVQFAVVAGSPVLSAGNFEVRD
jgi:Ca2+-binding RTX toxin-like protein